MDGKVFFAGRPTGPDVEAILKAYPTGLMVPGRLIEYEKIAEVIKEPVGASRFRTVTSAWKKRLEKVYHIRIKALDGIGFEVLDGHGMVVEDSNALNHGFKKMKKAAQRAQLIPDDGLTSDDKKTKDSVVLLGGAMQTAFVVQRKKIQIEAHNIQEPVK